MSRVRCRPGGGTLVIAALILGLPSSCCVLEDFGEAIAEALQDYQQALRHLDHLSSPWSSDCERVLLSTGSGGLFSIDVRSGERRLLADGPIVNATYSPDGGSILYCISEGLLGPRSLRIMAADGSDHLPIVSSLEPTIFLPAWSPDGQWIAYSDMDHVDLVRADRSQRRRLGPGVMPVWSPDGERIASVILDDEHDEDGFSTPWIQLMQADGSRTVRIARGRWPSWSPDGRRIAFMTEGGSKGGEVFVIDAGGAKLTRAGAGLFPRWSPNGERILVQRFGPRRLVTIAADGSDECVLAEGAAIGHWSPDGRKVVFFRDLELFVVDADGSGERSLGDPETVPLSRP